MPPNLADEWLPEESTKVTLPDANQALPSLKRTAAKNSGVDE